MDANLFDFLKQTYDYEDWAGRNKLAESLFIWEYALVEDELPGWQIHHAQSLPPPPASLLPETARMHGAPAAGWLRAIQSIWSPPGGGDSLLNIDIYECASRRSGHELLTRLLGEFQSPAGSLQEQTAIGDVAFADPRDAVMLFARANLVILLRNAGRDLVPASELAARFDQEFTSKPEAADEPAAPEIRRFQTLEKEIQVGRDASLELEALARTEQPVWYKLFASSGEIRAEQERLIYEPAESGTQEITIYAIGADRHAARETLQLNVS
jgi:hypothetical protein